MENARKRFSANDLKLVKRAKPPPDFRLGDRARLNSGSPDLLVVDFADGDCVVVSWLDDSGSHETNLPRACLSDAWR